MFSIHLQCKFQQFCFIVDVIVIRHSWLQRRLSCHEILKPASKTFNQARDIYNIIKQSIIESKLPIPSNELTAAILQQVGPGLCKKDG